MSHVLFNPDMLHIDTIIVKKVSPFSGGSAILFDGTKIQVPSKYAKAFGDMYYQNGHEATVLKYGDSVLNIVHARSCDVSAVSQAIDEFKVKAVGMYFDGVHVYSTETREQCDPDVVSPCTISSMNPAVLLHKNADVYDVSAATYKGVVSFPISSIARVTSSLSIQDMNVTHSLNLAGLLSYANSIQKLFGIKAIDCFELPVYMVRYRTVNLVKLPKAVKNTHASGVNVETLLAHALGKIKDCKSYNDVKQLRVAVALCLSYNIIQNDILATDKVYRTKECNIPPLILKKYTDNALTFTQNAV